MAPERLVLHPFGSQTMIQRYTDATVTPSVKAMLETARKGYARHVQDMVSSPDARSAWTGRNTLDPALHQAISHFLRGQTLLAAGFELEGLVAFDCVLQSLQFMSWSLAGGDPRRKRGDLCRALGMGQSSAELAEHIYFLRNNFVAHAGGWRWWDAGEFLDDELVERSSALAWRALRKAADQEPKLRRIDPSPSDWSSWLEVHFELIWKAVWFQDR